MVSRGQEQGITYTAVATLGSVSVQVRVLAASHTKQFPNYELQFGEDVFAILWAEGRARSGKYEKWDNNCCTSQQESNGEIGLRNIIRTNRKFG